MVMEVITLVRFDQHFLIDDRVADRIIDYAEVSRDEAVLEIGGGTGVLTERLLARTDDLTVVELDRDLAKKLRREHPGADVIQGDVLETELPDFDLCVSNLPYSISSEVTFELLRHDFDRAVLMYQREFADRLAAEPGTPEYGRLTVTVHLQADVETLEHVPRTAFDPRPRVDSTIVKLVPRTPDYDVDPDLFRDVVRAAFTQRRKTLKNALLNTRHISGLTEEQVRSLDPDLLRRRPGTLAPEEYAEICNTLSSSS